MKLAKISLATLVALGAFSTVASATPLEEAIKNVDLSGFARYRYDHLNKKFADSTKENSARHRFTIKTTFKAALDDNFFGVLGMRYNANDGSGNSKGFDDKGEGDKSVTDKTFEVSELYLGYKVGGTTITAGKQTIGSFFTDDLIGTGLKVLNKDIQGLTLAAVAFDALEVGGNGWGLSNGLGELIADKLDLEGKNKDEKMANVKQGIVKNNLYGVGAMGSYDPVDFKLWYASLTNIADLIAADIAVGFEVNDDINFGLQAQYGHSNVKNKGKEFVKKELGSDVLRDTNLYTVEATTGLFGADLALGYVNWKVKDHGVGFVTIDDQAGFNYAGEQTFDYTTLEGKGNFFYAKLGYGFDKFGLGLDYVKGDVKTKEAGKDVKDKSTEYVARASYKYSKKLNFATWYSKLTNKDHDGDKEKSNQFRFEAKYSF
ncbi:major outer membrane protein [Campylobacter sp. RM16192]|uniref:major outer membrane protein n=1 Tax=Campylobacter sp. RM16192 TaxID=1660080 RepID=UPI001451AB95|nr:major outer membrane protein [Campylobacter sp. RM16192]QCD52175.1 major outer membrane protein [Campylobacter sp. RM16192]